LFIKQRLPFRLLHATLWFLGFVFGIMMLWYLLQPIMGAMLGAFRQGTEVTGSNTTGSNRGFDLLTVSATLWGPLAVVVAFLIYVLWISRREWRGHYYED